MNKHNFSIGILVLYFFFGLFSPALGQFTPGGAYADMAAGAVGVSARKTGNDILSISQGGYTQLYKVSVWNPNGSTLSFHWDVDITMQEELQITLQIPHFLYQEFKWQI